MANQMMEEELLRSIEEVEDRTPCDLLEDHSRERDDSRDYTGIGL